MTLFSSILIIIGLCLFETISSIDNAIINAEVLETMHPRARKWFLTWGLLFAVVIIRGMLPWVIVYCMNPHLGIIGSFTATFSNTPGIRESIQHAAPLLLAGGGIFLIFLFLHWLFLEEKKFGLVRTEKFFLENGIWFYALASLVLMSTVWYALRVQPMMAFSAIVGSTAFFITQGFKQSAEKKEQTLRHTTNRSSDFSKIIFLEIIDAIFSIDGVLGAFAFTFSVPLILIGNGLGAWIVRTITIGNTDRIKKYVFLKNGAMYSMLCLGIIMLCNAFLVPIPEWVSPLVTILLIGYFLYRSHVHIKVTA